MTNSGLASGQQLVLPLTSDTSNALSKRQRYASTGSQSCADTVEFDCGGVEDDSVVSSSPHRLQFDEFLADPYRHDDDDDEMDVLQSMRTSESCTFSEGGSTPLMRSLSSTDWSQLRYEEADDKVASALKTMGLATALLGTDNTDRVDQTEELCQNLLIVLFTIMSKGIDSTEDSAWKVQMYLCNMCYKVTVFFALVSFALFT